MKYILIDSDRHVVEPSAVWKNVDGYEVNYVHDTYEKMGERAERLGPDAAIQLPPDIYIGKFLILNSWGENERLASAYKSKNIQKKLGSGMTPEKQILSMNDSDIEQAAIFPSFAMYIVNHEKIPPRVSLEYACSYNKWLYEYCSISPKRLRAVGVISRHEPSNMVEQLEKVISNGWTSITLRPEVICGRTLGHEDYNDFWAACEKHNIAVAFHGGTNLHAPTAGTDRFTSRFAMHACSHPMEAQMAFVSLLESGVLERHPRLKFAFLEAGASWVPHWLWRLDNICYPEFPTLVEENIKMLPSEYFKRQCWVGIELGEPCLREVIDVIGHDKLLYGSDFPHPDHLQFTTEDIAQQLEELTEIELQAVLEQNAKDFYGFEDIKNEEVLFKSEDQLAEVN
ncbi:hypothetical protein OA92_04135 [Marinomonas sp. SBI22]|uniref:amidohydrolase family protein n=1 Tax=unclassified Marinomonas TaxID=196814 RepID=UPI0007AF2CD0|nr:MULTISPECIES: amidohydrolase family protein [unclassified Marinomonas]KZM45051.1 hypothetical protein OA92_04135 [Marinomonas sp. SBI22]KZM46749.1 hypothetical protein OA91_03190 [Marinomonas sp. SBI8L]